MPGIEVPSDLIWDVIFKTAIVLAALYGFLWIIRRTSGGVGAGRRGRSLMVLQTAHLGTGRAVHVIGIGERRVLVGATSQQITLLAELDAEDVDAGEEQSSGAQTPFDGYMQKAATLVNDKLRNVRRGDKGSGGVEQ